MVDTSELFALVDEADAFHQQALALLREFPGSLLVPTLVVGETAFLIGEVLRSRAEALLLSDLAASDLTVLDVPRSTSGFSLASRSLAASIRRSARSTRRWSPPRSGKASPRSPPTTGATSPSCGRATRRPFELPLLD